MGNVPPQGILDGENRLLTAKEVMQALRIGRTRLHELTKSGQLPSVRMDRSIRYWSWDVRAYLDRRFRPARR